MPSVTVGLGRRRLGRRWLSALRRAEWILTVLAFVACVVVNLASVDCVCSLDNLLDCFAPRVNKVKIDYRSLRSHSPKLFAASFSDTKFWIVYLGRRILILHRISIFTSEDNLVI